MSGTNFKDISIRSLNRLYLTIDSQGIYTVGDQAQSKKLAAEAFINFCGGWDALNCARRREGVIFVEVDNCRL